MRTFEEARAALLEAASFVGEERVPPSQAMGRVLAEAVVASGPQPAFDYSVMDGYAVAVADLGSGAAPLALRVQGESRTGGNTPAPLAPGAACRIFTGAQIPERADAVVKQEETSPQDGMVLLSRRPSAGEFIRRQGEDLRRGDVAIERGTRLRSPHLALLTALEVPNVAVARRPRVALLSTGDELRAPGEATRTGSIVDSNGPALAALVESVGGIPIRLPVARDNESELVAALTSAFAGADLVITVGGASVGDHDLVRAVLERVNVSLDFWKVAVKPGMPLIFGRAASGRRLLGLPGNPASAMVTFMLFAAPMLRAMQGDRAGLPPLLSARLKKDVSHATGRLEFARARFFEQEGRWWAEVLPQQSSGSILSMAQADGLVLLSGDTADIAAGSDVRALRFSDV
jgi:molybdopterin molybdotransferase